VTDPMDETVLLRLDGVHKFYPLGRILPWSRTRRYVRAVDGISLKIRPQETLSLVGESGSGKTTTARLILRIEKPTEGRITFRGKDVHELKGQELRQYQASVQAVFQDPWASLNPRMRIRDSIAEPLELNKRLPKQKVIERVNRLLLNVGLEPAASSNFPHEFSGGQRQRIAVARALALRPQLIILDEPVSALDVSIRAQLVNLLRDLQDQFGMAYLLIAHDLGTVYYLSHRVAVMYLGQIVETASTEELFTHPLHPYTKALLSASLPAWPEDKQENILLSIDPDSHIVGVHGCRFRPRCPFAFARCDGEMPQSRELAPGHEAACHLY